MNNKSQPTPGKPVRGSKTGQPIMVIFDLLGRNWSMGVIWHLNNGPSTFRALQAYCENISPTTLNKRIKELTLAGFLERTINGYVLTSQGKELFNLIEPLGKWSKKWANTYNLK
ncbi:helix-turn-helix domain-containing protein [Pontimicrobium sp. SW4]|uniref:Helix-turn-helix domain-containing protein n=1 Tax=Pontimicrobium sp. SW4 TaxID=3153519 RepID=A0AAU7BSS7_9FLAO